MYDIKNIIQLETMHHAQCFIDETSQTRDALAAFFTEHKGSFQTISFSIQSLDIEQAQEIRTLVTTKSAGDARLVLIVSFEQATLEAQNNFLKAVEEPASGTYIIAIIPRSSVLIPTLRSRFIMHEKTSRVVGKTTTALSAKTFVSNPIDKRLNMVEKICKDKKHPFTKRELADFLDELEQELGKEKTKIYHSFIDELYTLKSYAQLSGCSPKMILEYTACVLPVSE